jgi:hypothetical protein
MLLAAAALMAVMVASAGPAAMAQDSFGNESDFNNGWDVVQYDDDYFVFDDAWDDGWWGYGAAELDDCYWWDGEYWCEVDF